MIPEFPKFKKLEITDRADVEKITSRFPPYSDFNFTSMWCWDIENDISLSSLNGNLVVEFSDYITRNNFYSFLGINSVDETVQRIIELVQKKRISDSLKLVGGVSASLVRDDRFIVQEDPGVAPLGYLNNKLAQKGEKKVLLDPVRAPLIRQMFEKVAYEGYSGHKILRWLNKETDFTTRSGKKIVLSMIYRILRDTYYYGKFEYPRGSEQWYMVNHESITTKNIFDKVQENLTVAPKRKPGTQEFDFTRMIQCGSCGSGVTAEEKFKHLSDGTVRRYVYYHCSKGKRIPCDEPYIREEDLLTQLLQLIDEIEIDEMCVHEQLSSELERYKKFMIGVLQVNGGIVAPEVDIRSYAKYVLRDGTREEKRSVLLCLKSKLTLQNQHVTLAPVRDIATAEAF